jgi:membrane fusion protein, multidrug efflux system
MTGDLSPQHANVDNRWRAPRWLKRGWPHLVWFGTCVAAFLLWFYGARFGGMKGVVVTVAEPVTPMETARLVDIRVMPGQVVKAGDVIAILDTSLIEAQMAYEQALMREAETTITGYQQNILQLARDLEAQRLDAEADLAEALLQQQTEDAELAELKREQARLEDLLARQLVDAEQLGRLRPRIAALETAAQSRATLLEKLEQRAIAAQQRQTEAEEWLKADETGTTAEAINRKLDARREIYEASFVQQELRKSLYTLRANRDGVVSRIYAEPGDVVDAGEVVVRIVLSSATHVEGFLPENFISDIRIGQTFHVTRVSGRTSRHAAKVLSIAPEVTTLPGRISPINAQPLHGRRVLLELQGETDLIPGENVNIQRLNEVLKL